MSKKSSSRPLVRIRFSNPDDRVTLAKALIILGVSLDDFVNYATRVAAAEVLSEASRRESKKHPSEIPVSTDADTTQAGS